MADFSVTRDSFLHAAQPLTANVREVINKINVVKADNTCLTFSGIISVDFYLLILLIIESILRNIG